MLVVERKKEPNVVSAALLLYKQSAVIISRLLQIVFLQQKRLRFVGLCTDPFSEGGTPRQFATIGIGGGGGAGGIQ